VLPANYGTGGFNIEKKQSNIEWSPFNGLASEYDAWFENDGKLIFAIEVQAFRESVSSSPKPWLEIGVGSGRFAQALGIDTGLDPSSQLIQVARRRGITVFLGRGEQQVFEGKSFGTVFLIVTMCFLDSPFDVLKQTNRILRADGKIVLGLVLKESPWGEFYRKKKEQGHRFYKYATFYNYSDVERLLMQAGFLVEQITSTLFQQPGNVREMEEPKQGYYPDAGFTVIIARKTKD
jgi:SAM-dependent methyltransferase